jgi:hypothetical protein
MNRGDRREAIFEDDQNQWRFLQTLRQACEKTGWQDHFRPLFFERLQVPLFFSIVRHDTGDQRAFGSVGPDVHRAADQIRPIVHDP